MPGILDSFAEYINKNPNKKRISAEEKWKMVGWLRDPSVKPSCQKDYSRRNYAQKTYRWDENRRLLFAVAKNGKENDRIVITVEEILQVVEAVHITDHAGWDATWSRVSKTYSGIVRSDVIWLITRCGLCKVDPRKKSRGNHEAQASTSASASASASTSASAPALPPLITLPEAELGCNRNDDATIHIQTQQNVFEGLSMDAYLDVYLPGFQDMAQDGTLDAYQDGTLDAYLDDNQDEYLDLFPDTFQDSSLAVQQGGFPYTDQGGVQSSEWMGQEGDMGIDPSLLTVDPSLYANYSPGEPSGTNNYTYNNESGQ